MSGEPVGFVGWRLVQSGYVWGFFWAGAPAAASPLIEEALNFGQTRKMTEGSRARPAEIDTIVAALEDRLGSTWAEFQSTPSHFNAVNADDSMDAPRPPRLPG